MFDIITKFLGFNNLSVSIGIIVAVLVGLIIGLWKLWPSKKKPKWLETLYGYALKLVGIPKFFVDIIANFGKMFLATQESIIAHLRKSSSRIYLVVVAIFAFMFFVASRPNADWQLLTGGAGMITASAFVLIPFIKSRDKEHERGETPDPPEN